jgi:hypothetical protein
MDSMMDLPMAILMLMVIEMVMLKDLLKEKRSEIQMRLVIVKGWMMVMPMVKQRLMVMLMDLHLVMLMDLLKVILMPMDSD